MYPAQYVSECSSPQNWLSEFDIASLLPWELLALYSALNSPSFIDPEVEPVDGDEEIDGDEELDVSPSSLEWWCDFFASSV